MHPRTILFYKKLFSLKLSLITQIKESTQSQHMLKLFNATKFLKKKSKILCPSRILINLKMSFYSPLGMLINLNLSNNLQKTIECNQNKKYFTWKQTKRIIFHQKKSTHRLAFIQVLTKPKILSIKRKKTIQKNLFQNKKLYQPKIKLKPNVEPNWTFLIPIT